jgi:hypothetical protein
VLKKPKPGGNRRASVSAESLDPNKVRAGNEDLMWVQSTDWYCSGAALAGPAGDQKDPQERGRVQAHHGHPPAQHVRARGHLI